MAIDMTDPSHLETTLDMKKIAPFEDESQQMWWDRTAPLLTKVLSSSNYSLTQKELYLSFYAQTLIPLLGPYPQQFRSAVTRSGLPVEFSVNYQQHGGAHPVCRIGFEPVSKHSGSAVDPYNQLPLDDLLRSLAKLSLPGYDTALFDHFIPLHTVNEADRARLGGQKMKGSDLSPTQVAFGFDLIDGSISVKAYTFPALKCTVTGKDIGTLFRESIIPLPLITGSSYPAFDIVNEYMNETDGYSNFAFFSWDCIAPSKSRLKLYSSTNIVASSKVEEIWTLGGRVKDPVTMTGLKYLQRLWNLLKINEGYREFTGGFDDGADSTPTPIIWNYEMKPACPTPMTKLYFPIHGQNDLTIVRGLAAFFEEIGLSELGRSYEHTVRDQYPDRDLSKTACLTSWISFAYKETTGCYLSVYYHSSLDYPWAEQEGHS